MHISYLYMHKVFEYFPLACLFTHEVLHRSLNFTSDLRFFFLRPKRYFSSKSFLAKSLLRFKFPKCDDNISALTHSHTVRIKYNILYLGCKFQVCIKLFQLGCSSNIISNTTYSFLLLKNRSVGQTIFIGKKMTIDYFSFISFHPSQRYASKSRYMSFFSFSKYEPFYINVHEKFRLQIVCHI